MIKNKIKDEKLKKGGIKNLIWTNINKKERSKNTSDTKEGRIKEPTKLKKSTWQEY